MISEDSDFWGDEPSGCTGVAFVGLMTGLAGLLFLPFDLFASLRDGRHPQDDALDEKSGADWGVETNHIGGK